MRRCVRWGHRSPKRGTAPTTFWPVFIVATVPHPMFCQCLLLPNGWMDQDATWYGGIGPGDVVLDGDPALPPPKKRHSLPQFSAHVYCGQTAGWIKMPHGTMVGPGPCHIVLDGDPPAPSRKAHSNALFSVHVYCGHGRPSQLLMSSCYGRPM